VQMMAYSWQILGDKTELSRRKARRKGPNGENAAASPRGSNAIGRADLAIHTDTGRHFRWIPLTDSWR